MSVEPTLLKRVTEAAILASGKPLTIPHIQSLFDDDDNPLSRPSKADVEATLLEIQSELGERGFELKEVASGWRFQVKQDLSPWVSRLWDEKPQKYSRALLETLSLIAYRQPITRGEIEEIRGVAVSSNIVKTLSERNWVKVIGHKDVPGRPAMYATTKDFLDYFNMSSLEDLPTLAEIRDLDTMNKELNLEGVSTEPEVKANDEFGFSHKLEGMSEEQISQMAADEVSEENRQAQERRLAASMDDDLFDGLHDENDTRATNANMTAEPESMTTDATEQTLAEEALIDKVVDQKADVIEVASFDSKPTQTVQETSSSLILQAEQEEREEREERIAAQLEQEAEDELEAAILAEQAARESEDA